MITVAPPFLRSTLTFQFSGTIVSSPFFPPLPRLPSLANRLVKSSIRSGASISMSPLLMEFRLKMSPKEPQMTSGMPAFWIAVAACSRDEPVPKL